MLSAVLVMGMLPITALPAAALTSGEYRYSVGDDGGAVITGYTGSGGNVAIPDTLDGHAVIGIGESAFMDCSGLSSVTVPAGVTVIESYAFAFADLKQITLPDTVTEIQPMAFKGSGLTSIDIPDHVKLIGFAAFQDCISLSVIHIPDSVVNAIGNNVFTGSRYYRTGENWDNGVLYIDHHLVAADNLRLTASCTVRSDTRDIAACAFQDCTALQRIVIPTSVAAIGTQAFDGCSALTDITIEAGGVSIIEPDAFRQTGYYHDPNRWAEGVLYIGEHLYAAKKELLPARYTVRQGTKTILPEAFADCTALSAVILPDSVTEIGYSAFANCDALTLYGFAGGCAERYAEENEIRFVYLNTFLREEATGVEVSSSKTGVVPDGAVLTATQTASSETAVTYDITLTRDGQAVQPTGEVTVQLPVPESMSGQKVSVYRVESDGNKTDMNAQVENGYAVFTTDHFSRYLLEVEQTAILGDINGSGKVDVTDALAILRMAVGLEQATPNADLDGVNGVTVTDALAALRIAVGLA